VQRGRNEDAGPRSGLLNAVLPQVPALARAAGQYAKF
jgi:hypothetical protein